MSWIRPSGDEQAGRQQRDAGGGCCSGGAEEPAAAGDDRDRGEDDADLEGDLGQLEGEVLGIGVVDFTAARFDFLGEVDVYRSQAGAYAGLVGARSGDGARPRRGPDAENPQEVGVAPGDVDFHPVALQARVGGRSVGLAGDYLFQGLVGEEGRHRQEGGDHRDHQRRQLRVMGELAAARGVLSLFEALV